LQLIKTQLNPIQIEGEIGMPIWHENLLETKQTIIGKTIRFASHFPFRWKAAFASYNKLLISFINQNIYMMQQ
jgi:hypothetical protein